MSSIRISLIKLLGGCPDCSRKDSYLSTYASELTLAKKQIKELTSQLKKLEKENLDLKSDISIKKHESDSLLTQVLERDRIITEKNKELKDLESLKWTHFIQDTCPHCHATLNS